MVAMVRAIALMARVVALLVLPGLLLQPTLALRLYAGRAHAGRRRLVHGGEDVCASRVLVSTAGPAVLADVVERGMSACVEGDDGCVAHLDGCIGLGLVVWFVSGGWCVYEGVFVSDCMFVRVCRVVEVVGEDIFF
ncbi:uncharacterized protein K452DRAFT_27400 [Aplosporella prunicola CBS 121167]|uniref:Uncharacterized protein n=1 Tax=Aplosporella prunicola CBS 121167 TaxID=1176127 RepID=A0A6A6BHX7_9PEZI|nr:uncharacterized protein K452DRAFT_27400 [Aplosporella prunicola CBS 121167]KAF2142151.1 hypothetical protein K452DRAFT_27400 [Aplosporella prunicola CBS 121167]